MKIAITTNDGKTVNEHFGKAKSFSIYEKSAGELNFIETCDVESYCECKENGEPVDPNHKFSDDRFSKIFEQIKGCEMVYTKQIGDKPAEALNEKGIKVKLCGCEISQIPTCNGNCK